MKLTKSVVFLLSILLGVSYGSALSCTDLSVNVSRYQESSRVLALQNFLYEKGYLKATPNGYFGNGTFLALKLYQKSKGLDQVGVAGPATRKFIKEESCDAQAGSVTANVVAPKPVATSAPVIVTPAVTLTPSEIRNNKRREDVEKILVALGKRFVDSRGVHPVKITEEPIELCVEPPYVMPSGTTTEVAVLASPEPKCKSYVDIAHLTPTYLTPLPRDPSYASSSLLTGYMITRSEYNDIIISAKNPENKAIIKAKCNFSSGCQKIERISSAVYEKPTISSIDKPIILRDSVPKTPITIKGKSFTSKNIVSLFSNYTAKEYIIGEFSSADGLTIPINASSVHQVSCGTGCVQPLPFGDYAVTVKNEGGISNTMYISVKGYTTSSFSARANNSVTPKTNNVKLGTISISSTIPLTLQSLTLTSTSTSSVLPGKLTKFVLKDPVTNTTINAAGQAFNLGGQSLYENQSKLYDVYADIAEVLISESGFISYGGKFIAKDVLLGYEMELPVKEFSFTVSY